MTFKRQNLLEPFAFNPDGCDFVFCRNVLIYQSVEGKTDVVNRIQRCIRPGGFSVMEGGETMFGITEDFVSKQFGAVTFYQRPEPKKLGLGA